MGYNSYRLRNVIPPPTRDRYLGLEIKPDLAEAAFNLGNALLQRGQVDEAITSYEKTVQSKPNFAGAHSNLGVAFFQKVQMKEAAAEFQAVLRLDPSNIVAQKNLVKAQTLAGQASGSP